MAEYNNTKTGCNVMINAMLINIESLWFWLFHRNEWVKIKETQIGIAKVVF